MPPHHVHQRDLETRKTQCPPPAFHEGNPTQPSTLRAALFAPAPALERCLVCSRRWLH
ncbi:hypothetical protein RISK_006157 [Rhodopirellula islandica]|uniref:Uncharacterized protein n=1 Tax=Rhodopirellula islandica TaxID=595434 RepID=A0A0J1B5V4_RHOIS|nr:hypothetical protein RISK_006157 [Rhodopirellula islandica]